MKLGQKFAHEVLEGRAPALTDEPDLEQNQEIDLHDFAPSEVQPRQVTIRIASFSKGGRWLYTLRDFRPNLLGRQSGYTHRPAQAIKARAEEFEPEAVDAASQEAITRASRLQSAERQSAQRGEELARRQARRVSQKVRQLAVESARLGVDAAPLWASIERAIREQGRELGERRRRG